MCKENRIGLILPAYSPAVEDDQQHAAAASPVVIGSKCFAGHRSRLFNIQSGKYGWRNIRQRALTKVNGRMVSRVNQYKRHGVSGVSDMRSPVLVDQLSRFPWSAVTKTT